MLFILIMLFTQTFWEDSTTKPSFEPFRSAVLVTGFAHLSWVLSHNYVMLIPLPTHHAPVSWNLHNFVLRNCPTLALCWLAKILATCPRQPVSKYPTNKVCFSLGAWKESVMCPKPSVQRHWLKYRYTAFKRSIRIKMTISATLDREHIMTNLQSVELWVWQRIMSKFTRLGD